MVFRRRQIIKHSANRAQSPASSNRLVMLSDLHIWGPEDTLYRAFLRFLAERVETGDTLFITGDLFDIFIGSKEVFRRKYDELFRAFAALYEQKGVAIYYAEGNHDFYLRDLSHQLPGLHVLTDEFFYNWDNRTILFSHGDRINPRDYGYKAWRMALHNPFSKALIDLAPGQWVDRLGVRLSHASRRYNPEPNAETVTLFRNYACERISEGCDFVVMGHSHYLDDIKFKVGDHKGQYVNNGYPRQHHRFLEIRPGQDYIELPSWRQQITPLIPCDEP